MGVRVLHFRSADAVDSWLLLCCALADPAASDAATIKRPGTIGWTNGFKMHPIQCARRYHFSRHLHAQSSPRQSKDVEGGRCGGRDRLGGGRPDSSAGFHVPGMAGTNARATKGGKARVSMTIDDSSETRLDPIVTGGALESQASSLVLAGLSMTVPGASSMTEGFDSPSPAVDSMSSACA